MRPSLELLFELQMLFDRKTGLGILDLEMGRWIGSDTGRVEAPILCTGPVDRRGGGAIREALDLGIACGLVLTGISILLSVLGTAS